ncbi:hypothetical protein MNV49_004701 [Pseudohyphozyma bogoriensis]|nr:hypothetical protein MNV49_004701 [Pseudohyphozyma bogoriensis]
MSASSEHDLLDIVPETDTDESNHDSDSEGAVASQLFPSRSVVDDAPTSAKRTSTSTRATANAGRSTFGKRWSTEEVEKLKALFEEKGGNWTEIAKEFVGRSEWSVKNAWKNYGKTTEATPKLKAAWTTEEDLLLRRLANPENGQARMSWSAIALRFPSRTAVAVSQRGQKMIGIKPEAQPIEQHLSPPPSPNPSSAPIPPPFQFPPSSPVTSRKRSRSLTAPFPSPVLSGSGHRSTKRPRQASLSPPSSRAVATEDYCVRKQLFREEGGYPGWSAKWDYDEVALEEDAMEGDMRGSVAGSSGQ